MSLVVILDDRATNRHIFARLAESIEPDVVVQTFEDPVVALSWLGQHTPDIVITDFKMPNLDGAEFTRRFRDLPGCGEVPVVVLTVYDERSFRLRALEAGATDFLHSPVDHNEFITRARNLLKLRKQQLLLEARANSLERELKNSEISREEALRDSRERLAQIIDTVPALISATDVEGRCIFLNTSYAEAHGANTTEAGADVASAKSVGLSARGRKLDALVFQTRKALPSFEEEFIDATGTRRAFLTTKSPLRAISGEIVSVLTTSLDITERKRAETHLVHLAHHDALTDLPNRVLLTQKLQRQLLVAAEGETVFALHFLDLDRFKGINDVLGHSMGDRLLKVMAERLLSAVRAEDTVARLGGDEFAVLQTGITGPQDAAELAARLIALTSEPVIIDSHEIDVSSSIGITLFPSDGEDAEELLKNADLAMYRAKAEGGGAFSFFSTEMHRRARLDRELDADLRRALDQQQFVLFYQPQIDCKSGRIVGAEALLRWRREDGRIASPAEFLPRAEETGLIVPINEWVINEACREAQNWLRSGLPPLRIAVNLSPLQFRRQNIGKLVTSTLRKTGMDPRRLELEITENIVMENSEAVTRDLNQLRQLGIRFSIDDFGTGYSSFKYIKSFPVDRLKIDQYFVANMVQDANDAAIVRAIIGLAKSLKLDVVAEGVETHEQMVRLVAEGCDECQGYLFSRPIPGQDFIRLVQSEDLVAKSA